MERLKNLQCIILKVAESHFTWEPKSGSFIPNEPVVEDGGPMPWEA
jgi:hypothetical protein